MWVENDSSEQYLGKLRNGAIIISPEVGILVFTSSTLAIVK